MHDGTVHYTYVVHDGDLVVHIAELEAGEIDLVLGVGRRGNKES